VSSGSICAVDPAGAISPVWLNRPHRFQTLQKRLSRQARRWMGLWMGLLDGDIGRG